MGLKEMRLGRKHLLPMSTLHAGLPPVALPHEQVSPDCSDTVRREVMWRLTQSSSPLSTSGPGLPPPEIRVGRSQGGGDTNLSALIANTLSRRAISFIIGSSGDIGSQHV